ncbi:MAG TPA: heme-degrading domain-containing protein [Spirochaetia bacterium]|nr:heme-degrading domain-containing protein [Spirochaetia bacterium]
MSDLEQQIIDCDEEERLLVFEEFSNEDALELGLEIVQEAKRRGVSVTVDIERTGQKLFHHAMESTSPDNDEWIRRKCNVVRRTFKSSFHVGLILKRDGVSIRDKYFLDPMEYSAHGGCFPLTLRGTGVVGTIAVSGLPQAEDHRLVVSVIRSRLK